jgi:hypothetical protein
MTAAQAKALRTMARRARSGAWCFPWLKTDPATGSVHPITARSLVRQGLAKRAEGRFTITARGLHAIGWDQNEIGG